MAGTRLKVAMSVSQNAQCERYGALRRMIGGSDDLRVIQIKTRAYKRSWRDFVSPRL